MPEQMPPGE